MQNYLIIFSYDGSNFHGYQAQEGVRTVEKELDLALERIFHEPVRSFPSGRTDKGVHAIHQTASFQAEHTIEEKAVVKGLNSFLPKDIQISECHMVEPSFHARHSVHKKEYRYFLKTKKTSVFETNYLGEYLYPFDVDILKKHIQDLIGTHDFRAFGKVEIEGKPTIKTVYTAELIVHEDILEFHFVGNGFLKYSVRSMVGTLMAMASKRRPEDTIIQMLETKNRALAGKTIEPQGLYLWNVFYNEE